jgi:hypothetical protein
MIGATAIVTSFILFAMQVNVERLPHSLFRRFSTDPILLGIFGLSFATSTAGTSLSLISDRHYFVPLILMALLSLALVLRLLLQAYNRSLKLINPVDQLSIIRANEEHRMKVWNRRIGWMIPLVQLPAPSDEARPPETRRDNAETDMRRMVVLQNATGWDRPLRAAVAQSASYARRAGESGDLEVSAHALQTIVALTQTYIGVKGQTFHAHNGLLDNPFVTDGFINHTLEEMRRLRGVSLERRDERQLEQIFQAHLALIRLYAQITYPGVRPTKSHALLALGYLERAVEAAQQAIMVDTTMIGVGVLGEAAEAFLVLGRPSEVESVAKRLASIAAASLAQDDLRPIALTAVEQLSRLTILLLRTDDSETGFALRGVRDAVFQLAQLMLIVPDQPGRSIHSSYLAPFFSSTRDRSFISLLVELGDQVAGAEETEKVAAAIVADNLEQWAKGTYRPLRQLIEVTVASRSSFIIDLLYWVTTCSEVLFFISQAPTTRDHSKEELASHASWMFNSLSFIPRDNEVARWMGAFSFIEHIFDFGLMSLGRGWDQGFEDAWKLLLSWSFGAGREIDGWGTLEEGLRGLTALALRPEVNRANALLSEIGRRVGLDPIPPQDVYDHAAASLRKDANNLRARELERRSIERALTQNPPDETARLLRDIAAILSPPPAEPMTA